MLVGNSPEIYGKAGAAEERRYLDQMPDAVKRRSAEMLNELLKAKYGLARECRITTTTRL